MVVVGGVIPPQDFDELRAAGAAAIFPPGTVIAEAAVGLLVTLDPGLGDTASATRPPEEVSGTGPPPEVEPDP